MLTTIIDVARKAGVSRSTVSRVLNGNPRVDPKLAARVRRVMNEFNYQPSRVARSLRLRHNRVWAVVISDIRTGPFFADLVRGVEDVAHEAGYAMFLCNADEDPVKEAEYLQVALAETVAGVILTPAGPQTNLKPLAERGIPVVLADRRLPEEPADTVISDNVAGARKAVTHLLDNGYRRIACIAGPLRTTTGSERVLGYRMALDDRSVSFDESLLRIGDFREMGGEEAMRDLLAQRPKPDAVFICNNRMAVGALSVIYAADLKVPDDIAVVGYDELSWAPLLGTALTTVGQAAYDIGHESARLLLSRLSGYTGTPRTVVLPVSLNVRASSAPRTTVHRAHDIEGPRVGHSQRAPRSRQASATRGRPT